MMGRGLEITPELSLLFDLLVKVSGLYEASHCAWHVVINWLLPANVEVVSMTRVSHHHTLVRSNASHDVQSRNVIDALLEGTLARVSLPIDYPCLI